MNTLLRRVEVLSQSETPAVQSIGPLSIDQERLAALWRDKPVELTVTEFWLIACLASQHGQVKSRQQLMDAANVVLDDATITSHVKRIRRKFLAADKAFDRIETAYGMGYRWLA